MTRIDYPLYNTPPLDKRSLFLRRLCLRALIGGNRGHIGSTLSLIEIIRVLYDDVMRFDSQNPEWSHRDRFILSKGHGAIAQYALLADKGFISEQELDLFCRKDGILGGHPDAGKVPGVEASTGALGHGLSIGVGMALAARMRKRTNRVFVVCGDGEINEGSVWEAAMSASKHRLSNLTVLIDYNKIQSYGPTEEVMDLEPLIDKWTSFGFDTCELDGHNVDQLRDVLSVQNVEGRQPHAVICHTIKGKGFSFAEGIPAWHHKSNFAPEDIARMKSEVGYT